jgi:hypothetical protein
LLSAELDNVTRPKLMVEPDHARVGQYVRRGHRLQEMGGLIDRGHRTEAAVRRENRDHHLIRGANADFAIRIPAA